MPEQKRRFKAADFVSKIVKDPNSPPNTLLLQGYLGDSSDEGHVRLYLDPQLSDYVEIPEDAILHTQEIPNATLGETYVWINQDAELTHGKAGPQRLKAKFLEGRLQQQYLGGAAEAPGAAVPGQTAPFTIWQQNCIPHTIGIACIPSLVPNFCPTHAPLLCHVSVPVIQCHPSVATPCVSQNLTGCQSALTPCISHNVVCPTQNPAQCPVASGGFGCGPQGPGPEQFAAAAIPQPPTLLPHLCPSAVDACPSRLCPSIQPGFCATGDFVPCPSVPVFQCPSRIIVQCPSAVDACPSRLCPSVVCQPSIQVHTCPPQSVSPIAGCQSIDPRTCVVQSVVCQSVIVCPPPSVQINTCPSVHHPICPSAVTLCNFTVDPRTCVFHR